VHAQELADFDFRIYDEIDAVFDFPLSFYGVDILAAYPNAKVRRLGRYIFFSARK
jgi:hypothetical protein